MAYLQEEVSQKKDSTIASYQQSLRVLREEFGTFYLDEINRSKIAAFEAKQLRRVSRSKVKHYRAALSGLFRVALRHEWVDRNPCRDLDPIKPSNERFRYLKQREWEQLRDALDEPLRGVAETSIVRGMRLGEILALRWEDVNFGDDTITIRDTKGNRPRVIPLEGAGPIFDRQRRYGRYVFPSRTGNMLRVDSVSKQVNQVARDVGIPDFTFHDLRHTYASWYVQRGGDLYRLQLILGHKGPAMTQRYAHLRVDDLRDVAQSRAQKPRDFLH